MNRKALSIFLFFLSVSVRADAGEDLKVAIGTHRLLSVISMVKSRKVDINGRESWAVAFSGHHHHASFNYLYSMSRPAPHLFGAILSALCYSDFIQEDEANEMIRALLKKGVHPPRDVLHDCSTVGVILNLPVSTAKILVAAGASPLSGEDGKNDFGSLLFRAGMSPYSDLVRFFVSKGANVNFRHSDGRSVLQVAKRHFGADSETVQFLIQHGARE